MVRCSRCMSWRRTPNGGSSIKVAGKITPNPVTGQLVTTFENTPQQPFSKFTLKFRPGATAPLDQPSRVRCLQRPGGTDAVVGATGTTVVGELLQILRNHERRPRRTLSHGWCPAVQTTGDLRDRKQRRQHLQPVLSADPPRRRRTGNHTLLHHPTPRVDGEPVGDPVLPRRRHRSGPWHDWPGRGGTPLLSRRPSEIGHSLVGAGVGSVLAQNPGKIYLAGPYNGAPLSIVSITSAKVGPFDLGTVVIRFALDINPTTAQVEVSGAQSEAIPRILRGHRRARPRNPCVHGPRKVHRSTPPTATPLSITNTIDGAGANPTNPADQDPVTVSTPFQGADCSSLAFKPDVHRLHQRENQQGGRREPHREAHHPRVRSVPRRTSARSKSNSPNNYPPGSPRCRKRAPPHSSKPTRQGARPRRSSGTPRRSPRSSPSPSKDPRTSSATVAKRSPTSRSSCRATGSRSTSRRRRSSAKPGSPQARSRPSPTSPSRASN